jgi:hypothetical protein
MTKQQKVGISVRNFVAKNAQQFAKAAGPHGKTKKAERKAQKQHLKKELSNASN